VNRNNQKISIIILSYNRCKELRNTLDHLRLIDYPNYEIIVFDNASTDNSINMIKSHKLPVKVIRSFKNIGIAGYNRAVSESTGQILILLDDDSYIHPNALKISEEVFSINTNLGIMAFKILLSDGKLVTKDWSGDVTSFWGCGVAIRKDVWDKVGGYDEEFFLYLNEIDMAIRVWNLGYKVVYNDRCIAYHCISKKNRASGRLIYFSVRNAVMFHFKHIPIEYIPRTLISDLLSYFTLSIIGRCPLSWIEGVFAGIKNSKKAIRTRRIIKKEIIKFYIKKTFMWQWPYKQYLIKRKLGGIITTFQSL
jgi:GT2 family glycosyltransferase